MSETIQTGGEAPVSEEDRMLAILGGDDNASLASDAEDEEQPVEGAAPPEGEQPETEDQEAEPPETAPIEPPQFWTKEAKAHWDAIPAETQAYLVSREAERDAEVRRSQNSAAEVRKQAETLAGQLAQERAYLTQQLAPAIQEVTKRLQGDYSPQKLAELARTNPAAYVEKLAEREEMLIAHQAMAEEHTRTQQLVAQGEMVRLLERVPEWREPTKGQEGMRSMVALASQYGFSHQEVAAVNDHRHFLVLKDLHDARAELAALKKASEAPVRKAVQPVVTRPAVNASRPRPETGNRAMSRQQIMSAARSGNADTQTAAMAQILGL